MEETWFPLMYRQRMSDSSADAALCRSSLACHADYRVPGYNLCRNPDEACNGGASGKRRRLTADVLYCRNVKRVQRNPLFLCKGEEKHLKKFDSEVRVFRISCTYINKMFFIVRSERFT